MFLIGEPSAARGSLLIDEQRDASLSYAEVGASRDTPGKISGYAVDHNRVKLGNGEVVFVRASEALYAWKMFDLGWARLLPRGAPAGVGTTVAVLARHIGFRSLNSSRVVYEVRGEEGGVRKLGFAYGTLPENAESGQERFVVEWHPDKVRNDPGEDAMRGRLALARVVMAIGVFLVGGVALAGSFRGTDGPDDISGTKRADTIRGLGGNDRLSGGSGADEVYGNGGSDKINGNNGDDRIMVDDGEKDTVYCGSGTNCVYADVKEHRVHLVLRLRDGEEVAAPVPRDADHRSRGC